MELIDEAIYEVMHKKTRKNITNVDCCYNCRYGKAGKLCIQSGRLEVTSPDSVCHNYKGWLDD